MGEGKPKENMKIDFKFLASRKFLTMKGSLLKKYPWGARKVQETGHTGSEPSTEFLLGICNRCHRLCSTILGKPQYKKQNKSRSALAERRTGRRAALPSSTSPSGPSGEEVSPGTRCTPGSQQGTLLKRLSPPTDLLRPFSCRPQWCALHQKRAGTGLLPAHLALR